MSTKQPEALRLANMLEKPGYGWHSTPAECAAELQRLQSENDTLRAGYDAARLEIETLMAQVQQCGAGAGCCAQAARIEELEAQLEAVGAGGVSALMAAPAQPATAKQSPHPEYDKGFSDGWNRCEERQAAAPAQAAPVDAQHSTACLYHYALSRLGLRDNTGLRVLFWDAHNRLSWDSKTDCYVTPDADEADCGQCNAARAAQGGNHD